ncbi:MAG: D-glycero-beta-D-manno-heptose 1-phosphate adenylyltransferase [Desulfatiglandales bacterium]
MEEIRRWIDLVYPPRCAVCGGFLSPGRGDVICSECRGALQEVDSPLCRRCGVPFSTGPDEERLCESCLRRPPAYESARALYVYEETAIEAVHRFKYSGRTRLAEVFGPMLAQLAREWLPADIEPLVMPVPLHLRRLRERGFNQSLLLARHVAALPGYELDYLALCRVRHTPSQSVLDRARRRENVRSAFGVKTPSAVKGRDVVLVDDVSTTGSTLDACSRALLQSGARRVYGLTLARAPARRYPINFKGPWPNGRPMEDIRTKIRTLEAMHDEVARLRRNGRRLVFTNGCFDLLHPGHTRYLYSARALGDYLIVAVNSDRSVRSIKGAGRPIMPEDARTEVLASLGFVDAVVLFDEEDPLEVIKVLVPDVLVKGADWKEEEIVGADVVRSAGGEVQRVDVVPGYSTTAIIERIRSGNP